MSTASTPPVADKFADRTHTTKKDIKAGFERLGMKRGDVVLSHSSLSRFGFVEGGPDAVIDAILETIGPDGTIIMSAITTNGGIVGAAIESADKGTLAAVEPFDVANKKCWAGTIAETFRNRPGVKRSWHPTHSVSAYGALADEMIANHENAPGPCGEGTPYTRVCDVPRGFILLLGVSHESNTAMHGMEELAGLEYVLYPKWSRIPILTPEGLREAHTRVHNSYMDRHLGALESAYINGLAETVTHIGDSYVRFVNAMKMRDITLPELKKNPLLMLNEKGLRAWNKMKETGVFTRNPFPPAPK